MAIDKIGDMLARIKNAYLVKKQKVPVPYSQYKQAIAEVLVKESYLQDLEVVEKAKNKKSLLLKLRYRDDEPVLREVVRCSKPGCRKYSTSEDLPYVLSGYGIALISTSQGIMTAQQARKKGIGGEVICKLW